MDLFSLKGKVAVITGASRGLGRHMAAGLADAGAHVVLVARDEDRLNTLADEIRAKGGEASVQPLDLGDTSAIQPAVERIAGQLGRIDICVNNAGIIDWQPLDDSSLESFDAILDLNVKSTFLMAQACAAVMRRGGAGGRIVNIGSVLSTIGRAKLHAYCASKSAIVGLTRSIAAELGRDGITANVIAPGYFASDINASLTARPGYVEAVEGVTPMERWGNPAELVGTLVYLSSAASSYTTGQVIHVDGGISATFKFELVL